jgi:hypothetical protein
MAHGSHLPQPVAPPVAGLVGLTQVPQVAMPQVNEALSPLAVGQPAMPSTPQVPTGVPMVGSLPVVDASQAVAAGPPSIADSPPLPASPRILLQPVVSFQPVVSLQPEVAIQPVFSLRSQADQAPAQLTPTEVSIPPTTTVDTQTQPQTLPDGTVLTPLDGGQIQQKSPDGTVTIFGRDQQAISQTDPNGVHFDFLPNKQVLQTQGNVHTLFGANQKPISTWTGNDPSQASFFTDNGDGTLNLKDPDGRVTTLGQDGKPISSTLPDGTRLDFQKDGNVLQTQGDRHTLFGPDNQPIKTWTGNDESQASIYHNNPDGSFSLTDPDGTVTTFDRNGTPITTTTTDGQGHTTTITWAVDLPALAVAATQVRVIRGELDAERASLGQIFDTVEQAWRSPSGTTFTPLRREFDRAFGTLLTQLDETATKMQMTHDNIVNAESTNAKNLTPGGSSMTMRRRLVG